MRFAFCVACGEKEAGALEHHHLVPRSAGGSDDETNLITLCHFCHGKAHGYERMNTRVLVKAAQDAIKAAKAARGETPKCGGRKSYAERDTDMVALAKKLHRYPVDGRRRSLRDVAAELAAAGYTSAAGTPFPPASIARMIEQRA